MGYKQVHVLFLRENLLSSLELLVERKEVERENCFIHSVP